MRLSTSVCPHGLGSARCIDHGPWRPRFPPADVVTDRSGGPDADTGCYYRAGQHQPHRDRHPLCAGLRASDLRASAGGLGTLAARDERVNGLQ